MRNQILNSHLIAEMLDNVRECDMAIETHEEEYRQEMADFYAQDWEDMVRNEVNWDFYLAQNGLQGVWDYEERENIYVPWELVEEYYERGYGVYREGY
jgi:hypothetical protein